MQIPASITLKLAGFAALAFWGPDILVHAIRGMFFDRPEMLALTVTMPLTLCLCWVVGARVFHITLRAAALRMLLGIWLLGGLCMMMSATFAGGGFAGSEGPTGALLLVASSLFPVFTCMMATYDGSLGALLVVSLVLCGGLLPWHES